MKASAQSMRVCLVCTMVFVALTLFGVGCGDDGGGGGDESGVSWVMQAVNFDENGLARGRQPDPVYLYASSLRATSYKAEISTGTIVDGQPDTLDWVAIKDDPAATEEDLLNLDNPVIVEDFPLDPGTYENFRITVSNGQYMGYSNETYEYGFLLLINPDLPDDAQVTYIHCPLGIVAYDADGNFLQQSTDFPFDGFTLESGSSVTIVQTLNSPPVAWTDQNSDDVPDRNEINDNIPLPDGVARVDWDIEQ